MRGLSGQLNALFAGDHVVAMILAKLAFSSGTQYFSSGVGTVDYLGDTYTGVGAFGQIEAISEDRGIKMKGIRLSLQGVDTTISGVDLALNEAIQGRDATLYLVSYDYNTATIVEGFEIFSGYMDTVEMTRGQNATMVLSIESAMSKFDLPNIRRFSSEDHKSRYPSDEFFDLMPAANEAEINWGKNTEGYTGGGNQNPVEPRRTRP